MYKKLKTKKNISIHNCHSIYQHKMNQNISGIPHQQVNVVNSSGILLRGGRPIIVHNEI